MGNVLITLSLILLISCGSDSGSQDVVHRQGGREYNTINPVFDEYVEDFRADAILHSQAYNRIVPVNFKEQEGSVLGVCITYSDGTREIFIDPSWWHQASVTLRKAVIYHELGHCILNRGHKDIFVQSRKVSIMHSMLLGEYLFGTFTSEYIEELFTNDHQKLEDLFSP